MTQRRLALALSVSHGLISQWEGGITAVSADRLIDMCLVFGVDARSFFGPDSPYAIELVYAPEEIALLAAWRQIGEKDREMVRRVIRGLTLEIDRDKARPRARLAAPDAEPTN
jgi:transcriptional regulator with XRE-family HTH domain